MLWHAQWQADPYMAIAGWDLACKLVCKRNAVYRGRLSPGEALRHRFLLLS